MTTSLATAYRLPKVDYPAAWAYIGLSTLLPYPKETTDLAASFKPFSYEVGDEPLSFKSVYDWVKYKVL